MPPPSPHRAPVPPKATFPPDRYADAVRARRAELRAGRDALAGHRAELRTALALARLAVTEEFAAELGRLGGQARVHLGRCGPGDRARFPTVLLSAVDDLRRWAAAHRDATVRSAALRVAARRGLDIEIPRGCPPGPFRPPPAEPARPGWVGAVSGWRAALIPAALLPLLGLPVTTPSAVAGATGLGIAVAVLAGGQHLAAADRLRLRHWSESVLAAARAEADAALARLLLGTEQGAGAALDAAVACRRGKVEAELARLAPRPHREEIVDG
jgi:hypothetical protein